MKDKKLIFVCDVQCHLMHFFKVLFSNFGLVSNNVALYLISANVFVFDLII